MTDLLAIKKRDSEYLRLKLFLKYGKVAHQKVADDIEKLTGRRISRQYVDQVVRGNIKVPWVRRAIAEIVGEPLDKLFFTPYERLSKQAKEAL